MKLSTHILTYLLGLAVVAVIALYAPWLGMAAGLFTIGKAAWDDDWFEVPMACIAIAAWICAVYWPWTVIGTSAGLGLVLHYYLYTRARDPKPPPGCTCQ